MKPEPNKADTPSLPSHVYVVATAGFRIAIESSNALPLDDVITRAIERFNAINAPELGMLMEITECSDGSDPSNPLYVHAANELEKRGLLD